MAETRKNCDWNVINALGSHYFSHKTKCRLAMAVGHKTNDARPNGSDQLTPTFAEKEILIQEFLYKQKNLRKKVNVKNNFFIMVGLKVWNLVCLSDILRKNLKLVSIWTHE
jgi:hypothetical protein